MSNKQHQQPNITHHKAPPEIANAGKLFVVRDADWSKIWGANLAYSEAHRLKNKTASSGKSRTVKYEEMPTDPALLARCLAEADVQGAAQVAADELAFDQAALDALEIDGDELAAEAPTPAPAAAAPPARAGQVGTILEMASRPAPTAPLQVTTAQLAGITPPAPAPGPTGKEKIAAAQAAKQAAVLRASIPPAAPTPTADLTDAERAELITRPPPPVPPEFQPVQPQLSDAERAALITTGPEALPEQEPGLPASESDIQDIVGEVFAGATTQVEVDNRLMQFVGTCGDYGIRAVPGTAELEAAGSVKLSGWSFTIVPDAPIDAEGAALDAAPLDDIMNG